MRFPIGAPSARSDERMPGTAYHTLLADRDGVPACRVKPDMLALSYVATAAAMIAAAFYLIVRLRPFITTATMFVECFS